jgi:hypothetical protein
MAGDMPRCFSIDSAISARPVRAADPWRSMFSEDGGVGTVSSTSVRRIRSRRGAFWTIVRAAARRTTGFFAVRAVLAAAVLAAAGFADDPPVRSFDDEPLRVAAWRLAAAVA